MNGLFISFEGVEGCGKSTQIRRLSDALIAKGEEVVLTREPGGTPISEKIRQVLLDSSHGAMTPIAELLLYEAARAQHVEELIRPALKSGKIVLCDRYADATTAYQGAARSIAPSIIAEAHKIATSGLMPDITFLMDLSAEVGLTRARARNASDESAVGQDRFEREELAFHERVREGYLSIAKSEPSRVIVIDAARSIDAIFKDILCHVEKHRRP